MLSGWKFTSTGDSLINLQQTAYCANLSGYSTSEYSITVLGDDVAMTTRTVSASKLAYAMNAIGLIQHPDKTINSPRFVEFLRVLYDNEGVAQAYPTRLLPSLIYQKPWLSSFEVDSEDFGGQVARMKNWRSLANRMSDKNVTSEISAIDFIGGSRREKLGMTYEDVRKAMTSDTFVIEVKPGWSKVTKKQKIMEKAPKIIKPLEATLTDYDRERWTYIARDETFFGDIEKITAVDNNASSQWYTVPIQSWKTIPNLPFSKSWLKKLRRRMGFIEFAKLSLTWGVPNWKRDERITTSLAMIRAIPELYSKQYDTAERLKAEFIPVLPVPDSLISQLKKNIFADVVITSNSLEDAKKSFTNYLITMNWNDYIQERYGTTKTYI